MDLLFEDIGYFDITTHGLGIGNKRAIMHFAPKDSILLCGIDEVVAILNKLSISYKIFKQNGQI